jgi:GPI-anchor transamidase subunit GAA1
MTNESNHPPKDPLSCMNSNDSLVNQPQKFTWIRKMIGKQCQERWDILLTILLFLVGSLWILAHPLVSILTGELKCRGWYIDENSLDAGNFRYDSPWVIPPASRIRTSSSSSPNFAFLCDAFTTVTPEKLDNLECVHLSEMEITKIVPISNAITPVSESIVVFVPPSIHWLDDPFHGMMLHFLKRLTSSSQITPWLAKTILLVSPSISSNRTLDEAVTYFLDSYLGTFADQVSDIPASYRTSIIRNLIVLNVTSKETPQPLNEVLILPQGKRGALPNMDLVFVFVSVISRMIFLDERRYMTTFMAHPFVEESSRWRRWALQLPLVLQSWWIELGDAALFVRTMAVGPFAPHTSALLHGIDSLTLQVHLQGRSKQELNTLVIDFFTKFEGIIRALSNLHERLHHSQSQYILPSPYKFVSHSEYLVPNLLIVLPLVVRAVKLILVDIQVFDLKVLTIIILVWLIAIFLYELSHSLQTTHMTMLILFTYGLIPMIHQLAGNSHRSSHKSFHFVLCLVTIYCIIPLLLANVGLSLPLSLLFSPLISILMNNSQKSIFYSVFIPILLCVTWTPLSTIHLVGYYSPVMTLIYFPLHFSVCILWYMQSRPNVFQTKP